MKFLIFLWQVSSISYYYHLNFFSSAVNAWRLRQYAMDRKEPFLDFLRELVMEMFCKHGSPPSRKRSLDLNVDRYDGQNHWIISFAGEKKDRKRCKLCFEKSKKECKVSYKCEKCDVFLHIECFKGGNILSNFYKNRQFTIRERGWGDL